MEREVLNRKSNGLAARKQRFGTAKHQQKSSASVDTSIRVDRYEHPRRPLRASASTDADDKSMEYEEEKRWGERGKREVRAPFFAFATQSDANAICEYL